MLHEEYKWRHVGPNGYERNPPPQLFSAQLQEKLQPLC